MAAALWSRRMLRYTCMNVNQRFRWIDFVETADLFLAVVRPYVVDASSASDQRRSCSWRWVSPGVSTRLFFFFAAEYTIFFFNIIKDLSYDVKDQWQKELKNKNEWNIFVSPSKKKRMEFGTQKYFSWKKEFTYVSIAQLLILRLCQKVRPKLRAWIPSITSSSTKSDCPAALNSFYYPGNNVRGPRSWLSNIGRGRQID